MRRCASGPNFMPDASSTTAGWHPTTGSTFMTSGPIRRHRAEAAAGALVFIAGLLGGAWSWAQEPAAGWSLEKLMRELSQVRSSKARFVERKYLKVLKA